MEQWCSAVEVNKRCMKMTGISSPIPKSARTLAAQSSPSTSVISLNRVEKQRCRSMHMKRNTCDRIGFLLRCQRPTHKSHRTMVLFPFFYQLVRFISVVVFATQVLSARSRFLPFAPFGSSARGPTRPRSNAGQQMLKGTVPASINSV